MKRFASIIFIGLASCTSTQITQVLNQVNQSVTTQKPLTTLEVGEGLKEALMSGISKGADQLSATDGYFKNPTIKIPFPPDVKRVEEKLKQLGLGNEVDRFVLTLNRGAEEAAKEAKPIFIAAIKQMTIDDAWGILKGNESAATNYLQKTTTAQLKEKFTPVVQQALDKVNATRYYADIVNTYNEFTVMEKVNPDLTGYATDLAIQGLFQQIAKEEKNIRQDPVARTTDLLKRVFASAQ
jgi:hypothetical protein